MIGYTIENESQSKNRVEQRSEICMEFDHHFVSIVGYLCLINWEIESGRGLVYRHRPWVSEVAGGLEQKSGNHIEQIFFLFSLLSLFFLYELLKGT